MLCRFATSQPLNKDAMLGLSPFSLKGAGNPTPLATVPNEYVDGGEMSLCCADCMKHFESECKQVLEQERALSDSGVSQPCFLSSVDVAKSSEGTNAAALPTWLQKHKDMKTEEVQVFLILFFQCCVCQRVWFRSMCSCKLMVVPFRWACIRKYENTGAA